MTYKKIFILFFILVFGILFFLSRDLLKEFYSSFGSGSMEQKPKSIEEMSPSEREALIRSLNK